MNHLSKLSIPELRHSDAEASKYRRGRFRPSDLTSLIKARISTLSAFSAVAAFLIANPAPPFLAIVGAFAGFFAISAGASVVNHLQDRSIDRRMSRTRDRPLASGRISTSQGGLLAVSLMGVGAAILGFGFAYGVLMWGAIGVLAYNVFYPWLRRLTWAGVFVGALSGVAPAAGGWLAGTGSFHDARFLAFALFSYGWQVPHYWLLMLKYGTEYQAADIPTPHLQFTEAQVGRITFAWIAGLAGFAFCMPLFGLLRTDIFFVTVAGYSLLIVFKSAKLLRPASVAEAARGMFRLVTGFAVVVMCFITLTSILTKSSF